MMLNRMIWALAFVCICFQMPIPVQADSGSLLTWVKQKVVDEQVPSGGIAATSAVLFLDRVVYPDFVPAGTGRLSLARRPAVSMTNPVMLVAKLMQGDQTVRTQRVADVQSTIIDFDLNLKGLAVGDYRLVMDVMEGDMQLATAETAFVIVKKDVSVRGRLAVHVPASPVTFDAYPITFGVPFPWGALSSDEHVRLLDAQGIELPFQASTVGRWSKHGSARWLQADAVLPLSREKQTYYVEYGPDVRRKVSGPVRITQVTAANGNPALLLENGVLKVEIPTINTPGHSRLWLGERQMASADKHDGPYLIDDQGSVYLGQNDPEPEVVIEASGPIKAAVRITGWHINDQGKKLGKFVLKYVLHANTPLVQISHTFIITEDTDKVRYRDIGMAMPARTGSGFFGTPRVTPFSLAQKDSAAYLLQKDERNSSVHLNGKFVDEAGPSEGWMTNNTLTLSVRDFALQFPKELEVKPTQMIFHAWPAHNPAANDLEEKVSLNNVYRFQYLHTGALLDFKAPQWMYKLIAPVDKAYSDSMMKSNAIGIAKTHDLLLHVHLSSWEQSNARTLNAAFQFNPIAYCNPAWTAQTQVLGLMSPRDPERFPEVEASMDGLIDAILRAQQDDADYGMFNLGDAHHDWHRGPRQWQLHRIWRATHQNWPRWPWIQFARSGSKKVFDYAMRNVRHVADISHTHYSNEAFGAGSNSAVKIVGGVTDYKGIVHWHAGNRLGYNCVGDALMNAYYMTGDHRALTAAMEHADALGQDQGISISREGSGRVTSAVGMYYHTWDNDLLELAWRTIKSFEQAQQEDGTFESLLTTWTPHFQRYYELTGDPEVKALLDKHARGLLKDPAFNMQAAYVFGSLNTLSWAASESHTPDALSAAAWLVRSFTNTRYQGDDYRFSGTPSWPRNMTWSWFLCDAPVYLAALAANGSEPEPFDLPAVAGVRVVGYQHVNNIRWWAHEIHIKQKRDLPLKIVKSLRYPFVMDIKAVGSSSVRTVESTTDQAGKQHLLEVEIPEDGQTEYVLRLRSKKDFFLSLPLFGHDDNVMEVYALEGAFLLGDVRYWFNLPEQSTSFSSYYNGDDGVSKIQIFDPAGKVAFEKTYISPDGIGQFTLPVTGQKTGWSVRVVGNNGDGTGVLRYIKAEPSQQALWFSINKDTLFQPDSTNTKWD